MAAASIFFDDPDGNLLEYIARLDDEPQPELGLLLSWSNGSPAGKKQSEISSFLRHPTRQLVLKPITDTNPGCVRKFAPDKPLRLYEQEQGGVLRLPLLVVQPTPIS